MTITMTNKDLRNDGFFLCARDGITVTIEGGHGIPSISVRCDKNNFAVKEFIHEKIIIQSRISTIERVNEILLKMHKIIKEKIQNDDIQKQRSDSLGRDSIMGKE